MTVKRILSLPGLILMASLAATMMIYWPGLSGAWLFDDYPNIVDNHGVQPENAKLSTLIRAALSSPASEFKRPLASLSFAINYLLSGLDPYWMKLTNLGIHLLNGWLVFALSRRILGIASSQGRTLPPLPSATPRESIIASVITGAWLLLPINLTAVLYVVQRMESLANLFVLSGLIGYLAGRQLMMAEERYKSGFALCVSSVTTGTVAGLLAKETAIMLPLYAAAAEWILFGFRQANGRRDVAVITAFLLLLALPLVLGLAWLLPGLLQSGTWANRDFTLGTRLLSEARIVSAYVLWTLFPTFGALSFYHDDFANSSSLLSPWTTLAGIAFLAGLVMTAVRLRKTMPIASLGLLFFLGCHLLTGTILPLELIYEHRNYFASFGLLLVVVPFLTGMMPAGNQTLLLPRQVLLGGLIFIWTALTAMTAHAWSNPLNLAEELAARAPGSPRAQYELGRVYIIYSHYDPLSPFTRMAYEPLERAAAMQKSSILPQQALIFMNSRMNLPLEDRWWDSMIIKLQARKPGVQDESSLGALTQCAKEERCDLPKQRMIDAFLAALGHPNPSSRLLSTYGDYAWNVLRDKPLALSVAREAVAASPNEPAYRITLIRMQAALGMRDDAAKEYRQLEHMNLGGNLDSDLRALRQTIDTLPHATSSNG